MTDPTVAKARQQRAIEMKAKRLAESCCAATELEISIARLGINEGLEIAAQRVESAKIVSLSNPQADLAKFIRSLK